MSKRPLPSGTKLYSEQAMKVFTGVRFDVYQWPQVQFDGSTKTFEVVKRKDTIIILPVIGDEVVLIKEIQPHMEQSKLTLVGGVVEEGEGLETTARRELKEETGLVFKNFYLVHIKGLNRQIEWFAYTFIATGLEAEKPKNLDSGEQNKTVRVSIPKLIRLIKTRTFMHPPRIIEEFLIEGREEKIKQIFQNPARFAISL